MNIRIEYQPNAKELARASALFIEKKPVIMFGVAIMNIVTGIVVALLLGVFFMQHHLDLNQSMAVVLGSLWLFGRKPFHEWLLRRKMQGAKILQMPITINVSLNGITWSGKGLKNGNMSWDQVHSILQAKNGFVMPNTFTRFLWLPFRGFQSPEQIEDFKALIKEKKIVYRIFSNWEC